MKSQKQRLLAEAAAEAHQRLMAVCQEEGATVRAVVQTLVAGLGAHEQRVFNSKVTREGRDAYQIKYSKKLIAWGPRLRAAELLIRVLQMEAPQRLDVFGEMAHNHKQELSPEIQEKLDEVYRKKQ
jgi:hypothetical protein